MVLEKEMQAKQIMIEAKEKADTILREAQEKSEEVYRKTYQKAIARAKEESIKIKDQAKVDSESEAQIFLEHAKKQKEKTRIEAEKKFDIAVKTILHEILS